MSDTGTPTSGLADRVAGTAKKLAGAVLGNEDLKREGELHHEKVEATKQAAQLEQTAERERTEAELTAREREIEIERQRLAAESAADAAQTRAEQERLAEERRIAAETAARE